MLLDNGSQRTLVREDLARKLCCPAFDFEDLTIVSFGSTHQSASHTCGRVTLQLAGLKESCKVEALTIPDVCSWLGPPVDKSLTRMLKERILPPTLAICPSQDVDVLVGADYYWRFVSRKILGLMDDLTAVETVFRWVIQGPIVAGPCLEISAATLCLCCTDTSPVPTPGKNQEGEETGVRTFEAEIVKQEGRHEVHLNISQPGLPIEADNRVIAEKTLQALLRRFSAATNAAKLPGSTQHRSDESGYKSDGTKNGAEECPTGVTPTLTVSEERTKRQTPVSSNMQSFTELPQTVGLSSCKGAAGKAHLRRRDATVKDSFSFLNHVPRKCAKSWLGFRTNYKASRREQFKARAV